MTKYMVVHCKHEGCYNYKYFHDTETNLRLTSITINPPKIFLFDNKHQANDFFGEYINDVDVTDHRCKKGEDVAHIEYCTCGVIEMDDDENPVLFYNKKNQIFLIENTCNLFAPPQEIKSDIVNMNLTNRLLKKCKNLEKEQRKKYIELGKLCEEYVSDDDIDNSVENHSAENHSGKENVKDLDLKDLENLEDLENLKHLKDVKDVKDVKEDPK